LTPLCVLEALIQLQIWGSAGSFLSGSRAKPCLQSHAELKSHIWWWHFWLFYASLPGSCKQNCGQRWSVELPPPSALAMSIVTFHGLSVMFIWLFVVVPSDEW